MKQIFLILALFIIHYPLSILYAQNIPYTLKPDAPNIHSVQLLLNGNPQTLNILRVNYGESLMLNFDDFSSVPQYYYYTLQLCNAQWQPTNTPTIRYIDGVDMIPINDYQYSMVALPYIHYQAQINNAQMRLKRSGNYILKVCLNGDTSQTVFERRIIAVDQLWKVKLFANPSIAMTVSPTTQTVQTEISIPTDIPIDIGRQLSIAIYQNGRWDNAYYSQSIPFIQGLGQYVYGYNQDIIFPAGNGWRYLDISTLRTYPDFAQYVMKTDPIWNIYLNPQFAGKKETSLMVGSRFGTYLVANADNINYNTFSNYVYIHFPYRDVPKEKIYLIGKFNEYNPTEPMVYDSVKQVYTGRLLLKQGFYDYNFVTKLPNGQFSFDNTAGNYANSPNEYTAFLYYWDYNDIEAEKIYAMDKLYFNVNN